MEDEALFAVQKAQSKHVPIEDIETRPPEQRQAAPDALERSRARIGSLLDKIPGVGPARRAALLKAFGSVDALREATPEAICERSNVPLPLARRVAENLSHRKGAA